MSGRFLATMSASVTCSSTARSLARKRDPYLLQGFGRARIGDVLGALAPDAEQLAVDGPDDVGQ